MTAGRGDATPDPAMIERAAEAIADVLDQRQKQQLETCPAGCGCSRMTEDPDRRDCACDGPCCMDPHWWDGFIDNEVAARAAAGVIVPATAEAIAAALMIEADDLIRYHAEDDKGFHFRDAAAFVRGAFAAGLSTGATGGDDDE